jgi:DNA-binding CsgD family transcriptional regulator
MSKEKLIREIKNELSGVRAYKDRMTKMELHVLKSVPKCQGWVTVITKRRRTYRRLLRSAYGFDVNRMKMRRLAPEAPDQEAYIRKFSELVDIYLYLHRCHSDALAAYRKSVCGGASKDVAITEAAKAVFELNKKIPHRALRRVINDKLFGIATTEADLLKASAWVRSRMVVSSRRLRFLQALEIRPSRESEEVSLLEKLPGAVAIALSLIDTENEIPIAKTAAKLVSETGKELVLDRPVHRHAESIDPVSQAKLQWQSGVEISGSGAAPNALPEARRFEEREVALIAVKNLADGGLLAPREEELLRLMIDEPDATRERLAVGMGISPNTVDVLKFRIRNRLKDPPK